MLIKVFNGSVLNKNLGTVEDYVKDRTLEALYGCTNPNIYEDYLEFCADNNFSPMPKTVFFKALSKNYNTFNIVRKIKGKSYRILVF